MEHAIRHHIKKKLDEDPVYYQKLSERLEEILKKFEERWEQLALALADFTKEVGKGRQKDDETGLDPVLYAPFYDLLKEEREEEAPVRGADAKRLADLTVQMVEQIVRDGVSVVGFWRNATRQEELRAQLFMFLDDNEIVDFERCDAVADRLMELTKANHGKLLRDE
jgi:type I restriction enzyme R subunit